MPANSNFNAQTYLAANPALVSQWNNPEFSAQLRAMYPTLEAYAAADAGQDTDPNHAASGGTGAVGPGLVGTGTSTDTGTTTGAATTTAGGIDLSRFSTQYPPQVIQAVQALLASKPEQVAQNTGADGQFDLPGFINSTVGWWSDHGNQVAGQLDQFGPELQLLNSLGYSVNPAALPTGTLNTTGGGTPLEQALLQQALPGLLTDVNNDANRRTIGGALAQQTLAGADAANQQLSRATGGHFDGRVYFQTYPDVANAFNALPNGTAAGTKVYNGHDVTADQFAEQHYLQYGQHEGRTPAYVQSAQLAQDFNNANQTVASNVASINQATQTQLTALSQATQAMQQNLTGDLAARASALQAQLQTLNQNLDQLDSSQRAALIQQITSQQQNLEQSIATQRQALQDQVTALGSAATTQSQAQRAALEREIQGLNAAQAPVAAARTAAAQLQATAVNAGLQRTEDQMTADSARGGYVGGSTGETAALARASIDARQRAAGAMGGADLANATDTRDIAFQGAQGQRTIADALSQAQRDISVFGAGGNAALTGSLAQQRQQLGNAQATGLSGIANNTALARAGIGGYGANTTYGNATMGADQSRSIGDALAQGQYGLASSGAQQTQQAQQQGAAARATYYDNDWNRSLAASLAPGSVAAQTVGALTAIDNYGASGLGRTQGLLNWWNTNQGAAPTPGAVAVQPSTTGNSISNFGTGLFNGAMNFGNANNWWRSTTPTTQPVSPISPD